MLAVPILRYLTVMVIELSAVVVSVLSDPGGGDENSEQNFYEHDRGQEVVVV